MPPTRTSIHIQCVTTLLGYPKADLEGANVSVLMPQPFSGRHPSYLSRYVQGGEPRILDTVRDIVALHKERYVMPLRLCVTKLSGVGMDAVFLGLLRPEPLDIRSMRAWVAPNGVILCTDPQFSSLTGLISDDMVGRTFQSIVADTLEADSLLELCKEAAYETLTSGTIVRHMDLLHKYLPRVPVEIRVTLGGTDLQRIFVLNARRVHDTDEGLMVVDHRGGLTFATWDLAAMLGYPLKKLLKMKLEQLLPQPFSTMHGRFLRDQPIVLPAVSCRAGSVVHLVNSNGAHVHVRLKITPKAHDHSGHLSHVVQVSRVDVVSQEAMYGDKRLQLFCSMNGKILSVDLPNSSAFGFRASEVVGSNLADCIDVFQDCRAQAGAHQLELLLLSLLDKEAEMPGTSWQVKVLSPSHDGEAFTLPNIDPKAPPRLSPIHNQGVNACLQAELIDLSELDSESSLMLELEKQAGGGIDGGKVVRLRSSVAGGKPEMRRVSAAGRGRGSMPGAPIGGSGAAGVQAAAAANSWARITLWRRNLLSGTLELDESLVIRKADVNTGLIVGQPPSALPRMPLSGLIDIPKGISWDELMHKGRKKKSALKGGSSAVVSPVRRLVGKLPDGGTIGVLLQGVAGVSASGRVIAIIHPDSSVVGRPGDVFRALGLEATITRHKDGAATDAAGDDVLKGTNSKSEEEEEQEEQEEQEEGNSSGGALLVPPRQRKDLDALPAEEEPSKRKGSKEEEDGPVSKRDPEQSDRFRSSDGGDGSAHPDAHPPKAGAGRHGRTVRSSSSTASEGDRENGGGSAGGGSGGGSGGDGDSSSVPASFERSGQVSSSSSSSLSIDRDKDDMEAEVRAEEEEEEEGGEGDGGGRRRRGSSSGSQKYRRHHRTSAEMDAAGMAGQLHLRRDAHSHPEFIALWARWLSRAMTAALAARTQRQTEEAEEGSDGGGSGTSLGDDRGHGRSVGPNRPAPGERGAGGTTTTTNLITPPATTHHNKTGDNGTAASSLPAGGPPEDPLEVYDGVLASRRCPGTGVATGMGPASPARPPKWGAPQYADSAEATPPPGGTTQRFQRQRKTAADAPSPAAAATLRGTHDNAKTWGPPPGSGDRKSAPRLRFEAARDEGNEDDGDDGDDVGGDRGGGDASLKKAASDRGRHHNDGDDDDEDGSGDGGARGHAVVATVSIGRRAVRIQEGPAPGLRRGGVEGRVLRFADTARGGPPRQRVGSPPQRRRTAAQEEAEAEDQEGEGEGGEEEDDDDDEAYREIQRRASGVETNKMLAAAAEGFTRGVKARGGGAGDGGSNDDGGGGGMQANDAASSQADDDDAASKGPGSGAFSDSSSTADADATAAADPRRARLLKRITKGVTSHLASSRLQDHPHSPRTRILVWFSSPADSRPRFGGGPG
ncbi:hypothetical protein Vretimale_12650 [Volvox reticuliferus]|uniref:PAS domain-containing protein n=1 Tax=Volvox reticuliferus TaxID=1737510 RepID=A0A8J4LT87_9CHLO|nr:hypothetical protein Vretimale_12650 [Volvox reticuliferus]